MPPQGDLRREGSPLEGQGGCTSLCSWGKGFFPAAGTLPGSGLSGLGFEEIRLKKLAFVALSVLVASTAAAADPKVGFVNTERVFRDAAPAVRAQKKIEQEFAKRDQEMQKMTEQIRKLQESLEKNVVTMTETERRNKEREFTELNKDFQRKQREFREDLNQRRNEELAAVLERANRTIKAIAESEKYDIIFQEAVYASPRIDITDKVIKALEDKPAGK